MRRKTVWFVASCLTVAGLILAACAPAPAAPTTKPETPATPAPAGPETVKVSFKRLDGTMWEETIEKPKYGGTLIHVAASDVQGWDGCFTNENVAWALDLYLNSLLKPDWRRGPSGTKEAIGITLGGFQTPAQSYMMPELLESWEFSDNGLTLTMRLRKGVRFGLDTESAASRLVNGRELTSADLAWNMKRYWELPGSWVSAALRKPYKYDETPDKYTLIMRYNELDAGALLKVSGTGNMWAKEVADMAPNGEGNRDWRNAVGTGPYFLSDYVPNSIIVGKKNPNYWQFDPFIPENRLPYIDTIKTLIIPDISSRIAALRTAKIDWIEGLNYQQKSDLLRTNPQLQVFQGGGGGLGWRPVMITKPLDDMRVRQALSMAIDRDLIAKNYYQGVVNQYPQYGITENQPESYLPFDKLPADVQEIITYHPDKAKKLMAEAGYPNGFKVDAPILATQVDEASLWLEMWKKELNVEVTLKVYDPATYNSMHYGKKMFGLSSAGSYSTIWELMGEVHISGNTHDRQFLMDEEYNATYNKARETLDDTERGKLNQLSSQILLKHADVIIGPTTPAFRMWQPWFKRYNGEGFLGYGHCYTRFWFAWIDQDLKQTLTGSRD